MRGHAFALRPVTTADAAFIVDLRSAQGLFLNRGARSEVAQREWIERYFERSDDYYFVVCRNADGEAEGLAGMYDVDDIAQDAEWGRFILRSGSSAAVETALLVYRCAFDAMGLQRIHCRTLIDNVQVVAFHDSCGLARRDRPVVIEHDGQQCEAIEHRLSRAGWPAVRERLDRVASRVAAASRR